MAGQRSERNGVQSRRLWAPAIGVDRHVVIEGLVADARKIRDAFDGLERTGIDEISYRRGHKYLMVVVDHDTARWCGARPATTGPRCRASSMSSATNAGRSRLISADAAEWTGDCATTTCKTAVLCLERFHIVRWASQALDVVRRWEWNTLRTTGLGDRAKHLKNGGYALWKKPEDLTDRQANKLAWIARHNHQLYRACLLEEQLRLVFQHRRAQAEAMLDAWMAWARRCQILRSSSSTTASRSTAPASSPP